MELLLKAVLVAALAVLLHCGPSRALFTRRRLSPATERRIQEEDADGEFEEDSSSLYEEEVNKALERLSVSVKQSVTSYKPAQRLAVVYIRIQQ